MFTIEEAVIKLKNGDVVVLPTETVYGLAASIHHYNAIKKIFYLKKRPFYYPLIVHIGNINDINQVSKNIPDKAWKLIDFFFPGPLTLILEKKNIFNLITSGKNKVGVRMPNHDVILKVIQELGSPIVASSANLFNCSSPKSAEDVQASMPFLKKVILDGGVSKFGIASTILEFTEDKQVRLLRYGAISIQLIESVLDEKLIV